MRRSTAQRLARMAWEVSSSRTWVAPIFCRRSLTTRWASSGRLHSRLRWPRYRWRSSADMICSATSAAASFERWPCRPRMRCLRLQGRRGAILQHLHVMVRLQHQRMGRADSFEHQPRGMAQVRQETDVAGAGAEQVTNRVLGVVRDAERLDQDVAHFKTDSGGEKPAGQARLVLILAPPPGWAGCHRWECAASH